MFIVSCVRRIPERALHARQFTGNFGPSHILRANFANCKRVSRMYIYIRACVWPIVIGLACSAQMHLHSIRALYVCIRPLCFDMFVC